VGRVSEYPGMPPAGQNLQCLGVSTLAAKNQQLIEYVPSIPAPWPMIESKNT